MYPGLERSDNPGMIHQEYPNNPERVPHSITLSGLIRFSNRSPGLSLALQPWAGISERLRRYCRLRPNPWAGISQRLRRYCRLRPNPWAGISQRLRRYCRLRSNPGLELANAFGVIVA